MADTAFVNHKSGGQGIKPAVKGVFIPAELKSNCFGEYKI